jgi:transcriptional regulator GlxA family with amidase domain
MSTAYQANAKAAEPKSFGPDGGSVVQSFGLERGPREREGVAWIVGGKSSSYIDKMDEHRPSGSREGLKRRRLLRVLEYIQENLDGDLSIDCMASIACLSKFHFARAFKQAVGQSPCRYVSAKRLDRAKVLLAQSDRSLADIALALRFSCQASFTRAFRQATGQTPGQYRQRLGSR